MSIEKRLKSIAQYIINKVLDMKISMKLTVSYVLTVLVCILLLTTFFYSQITNVTQNRIIDLLTNTLKQSVDNINYKIELYNRLENMIYADGSLQDILVENYNGAEQMYDARNKLLAQINPTIFKSYSDIRQFSFMIANKTIPQYGEYVKWVDTVKNKAWYKFIALKNDNIYWFNNSTQKEEQDLKADTANLFKANTMKIKDADLIGTISVIRKLRHLSYDNFIGILKIDIDKELMFDNLREVSKKDNSWFQIINVENSVIYNSKDVSNDKNYTLDLGKYKENFKTISGSFKDTQGGKFDIYYDTINYTGWKIIYIVPNTVYSNMIKRLQAGTVFIILVCIIAFIFLSGFIAAKFTKKIRKLSKSMKKVQEGNFDVSISYRGKDEIGDLIEGFNSMAINLSELVEQVYTSKVKEKELELKLLQSQINPHFLYNTLASISWLGMRSDEQDITKISNSLAKYYRISLSKGSNIIKIREEINHVTAYMDIQNIRFKNKITMVYEVAEEVLEVDCLKLIIQPFIENAILHGLSSEKKYITIRLVVERNDEDVLWKVIDDGVGISKDKLKLIMNNFENDDHGYGITNVDQRIKLHFGDRYGIKIFSNEGLGTVVTINTPYL